MATSIDDKVAKLRRKLIRQRAKLAAHKFGFAIYLHWNQVARSEIEAIDLMREHLPEDVFLPNLDDVLHYLQGCKNSGQRPISRQVVIRICPWTFTEDDEYF